MNSWISAWCCDLPWVLMMVAMMTNLTIATNNVGAEQVKAEISPKDPRVENGTTLEMNCTLTQIPKGSNANASRLFFQLGHDELGPTTVLNDRTIQLMWRPVRFEDRAHIFCYMREHFINGKVVHVAQTTVTVAARPVKPNITGCVVYNWSRMVCTWEPANQQGLTGLPTNQTLYYSLT